MSSPSYTKLWMPPATQEEYYSYPFHSETRDENDGISAVSLDYSEVDNEADHEPIRVAVQAGNTLACTLAHPFNSTSFPSPSCGYMIAKPKRMLNTYNLFFQSQRQLIQKQVAVEGRKLAFGELVRTVSYRWKRINDREMAHFTRLSFLDKKRYEREMEQWKLQQDEEKQALVLQQRRQLEEDIIKNPFLIDPVNMKRLAHNLGRDETDTVISLFR